MNGNQIRRALAGALAGVARGLSASARMVEQASWILRPREPAAERQPAPGVVEEPSPADIDAFEPADTEAEVLEPPYTEEPAEAAEAVQPAADSVERAAPAPSEPAATEIDPAAEPPPTVPAPEGPAHARVAETHIAELADRSVADVVAEISDLSTDELEQLYAYEVTHKNRKTILRAIERAVQPASSSP